MNGSTAGPALVLGAGGQDGSYLCELLLERGTEVVAVVRDAAAPQPNLNAVLERLTLVTGDLADTEAISRLIADVAPDEIYNFAALTFGPDAWTDPARTAAVSASSVCALLEAVGVRNGSTRFFQASSAWVFGLPETVPQDETTPIRPVEPYGAAKAYGMFLVDAYRRRYDVFACSGIFYNHESPRRPPRFVTRKITRAAAAIKLGLEQELVLGEVDAARDWGYAPDYVEAAARMLSADVPGDYVVATGELHTVRELAEVAFSTVALEADAYLRTDPSLFRGPSNVRDLVGDAAKARRQLGWRPTVAFADLVRLMVEADLQALSRDPGAYRG